MQTKPRLIAFILLGLLSASTPGFAQTNAKQSEANNRQLQANKKLVLDFFRIVFQAENAEAARDFLTEDYVQHNPLIAGGRQGFIAYFKKAFNQPKAVEPTLKEQPAAMIAEGDLVTVVWRLMLPEPKDKSKSYETFAFDLFRVKNGKLVEHWDADTKQEKQE